MYKKASFRTGGSSTSGLSTRKQTESRPSPDQIKQDFEKNRQKERTMGEDQEAMKELVDAWVKKGIKLIKKADIKTQGTFVQKKASKRKKRAVASIVGIRRLWKEKSRLG